MNATIPIPLLNCLQVKKQEESCQLIPGGLINQTWLCKTPLYPFPVVLQQINTHIFKKPLELIHNHRIIYETWLNQQKTLTFKIAAPLPFSNSDYLYHDQLGQAWRIQEFIEHVGSITKTPTSAQLYEVARCFGEFGNMAQLINKHSLYPTLENFHNLRHRYQQFQTAITTGNKVRIHEAAELIKQLTHRVNYVKQFDAIVDSPVHFPLRVRHHDAKTANLLFSTSTNRVAAILDLDTTMPGYYFSDLGDMIRSMAGKTNEDHTTWEDIAIDADAYAALLDGYQSSMEKYATAKENAWIHWSGIWIIYMQCLRFITDYFMNDCYYKTAYARQNWDRAWNQYYLLKALEEHLQQKISLTLPLN
ncbi:MAG: aminoglycoside phosphotransferase family protein [Bacteroidetes bacterium]|nr:aminoglycoside phosphotransferase family protein [Bacteroidota bacterium]